MTIESKDHMHEALVVSIDQQIDKLKALESLRKEKDVVYGQLEETDDIEGARKLRDQLKHAQAEYDAEYESFTADDIND